MRVLLAFDKFKDALSAGQACAVAAEALQERHPDWELDLCPLTDGGDGFASILTQAAHGQSRPVTVAGPRGDPVTATFGLVAMEALPAPVRQRLQLPPAMHRPLAIIEMAAASGLALLPAAARDPWQTSSFGTGELIRAAHRHGCGGVLLGIGGSATNDLGCGALAALGLEFCDEQGQPVRPPVPAAWERIHRLTGTLASDLPPLRLACDVTNPLLGPQGCAAVFGPQKGLRPADLPRLEAASRRMARLLCAHGRQDDTLASLPGSGAAGGIAFGLMAAAHARLLPGATIVAEWLELDRRILASDIVITGEGRFDLSSLQGKGPGALVARARALGRAVQVFAGAVSGVGADAHCHALTPPELPLAEALPQTATRLAAALRREFR